jgi:hypothetical protein
MVFHYLLLYLYMMMIDYVAHLHHLRLYCPTVNIYINEIELINYNMWYSFIQINTKKTSSNTHTCFHFGLTPATRNAGFVGCAKKFGTRAGIFSVPGGGGEIHPINKTKRIEKLKTKTNHHNHPYLN